ncbi:MAG TPA: hypothetical protein VLV54_00275, partial [Thermoanaerobaculia bacterium]|nr:hypothetical protein [Thermoanaerobaculia bacterium]
FKSMLVQEVPAGNFDVGTFCSPGIIAGWRESQPAVKGMSEHAEEIEDLYERLLHPAEPA